MSTEEKKSSGKGYRVGAREVKVKSWPYIVVAIGIFAASVAASFYLWQFTLNNLQYLTAERLSTFVLVIGLLGSILLFRVLYALAVSKKAEALRKAQEQEQFLAAVLASAHDAIVVYSLDWSITSWNKGAIETYGYSEEEALGMNAEKLVPDNRPNELMGLKNKIEESGVVASIETERITKDGSMRDIWLTGVLLLDKAGRPSAFAMTERDITERKQAAKKLEEQAKELTEANKNLEEEKAKDEALLSSIGEGVIATDQERNIIFMNKTIEEMLGVGAEKIMGKNMCEVIDVQDEKGDLLPEEKRPTCISMDERRRIATTITDSNYYFVRADKTKFPAAITATPIITSEGAVGSILVVRDITEEKAVDQAKSEFVSLASHQLRTPLSTIRWYVETILAGRAGRVTKDQRQYLDVVYESSRQMVELVNALLSVSRIELGTFQVDTRPTDVIQLSDGVLAELDPQIRIKKLKLDKKYDDSIEKMNVDPDLVRIVFQNLYSNAVKYTAQGGKVEISITKKDPNILFKVVDSGYGIPIADQPKIFTKLYRATNVKEKETDGNGLGLYLVKSILDNSGGTIWFDSVEGEGTTFYATIPLEGMKEKKGTTKLR